MDQLLSEILLTVGLCSGVPLLCCCVVSLLLSIVQSATQIQEQTVSYLARLLTLVTVLFLFGTSGLGRLVDCLHESFTAIQDIGES
jgi:flagellar biosynthesis protein FliQ